VATFVAEETEGISWFPLATVELNRSQVEECPAAWLTSRWFSHRGAEETRPSLLVHEIFNNGRKPPSLSDTMLESVVMVALPTSTFQQGRLTALGCSSLGPLDFHTIRHYLTMVKLA
jgi:hypothetical protein